MSTLLPEGYTLRAMGPLDLRQCLDITRRIQWAHRGEDWAQAFRVTRGVVIQSQGRVIGTAVACIKGMFSSIGLIAIDPDFQRRGLGRHLTKAVLDLATQNVSLVATAEGRGLYESLGFKENGTILQLMLSPGDSASRPVEPRSSLRVARTEDSDDIHRLYRLATGAYSQSLLDDLLAVADAVWVVPGRDQEITGFCIVRPFGRGAVVGPIVGQTVEVAVDLIRASMHHFPQTTLRVDVNNNAAFSDALLALGFRTAGSGTRMFLGAPPLRDHAVCQFSLISQALL
ncbi:GNAT family N-acetyltransferase [Pandoraea terrigena]|uniref:N-acetyltransferase GCN5 n=1 Tax=Pandoraea terrigena TaxID=2508292 RepID=A0A5E4V4Z1_9BURK|nr:GNAT family N-acetyltransferase [Pandoraea terrigena]VVE05890.1 N-acetyltransferase GCN5 [Pandoraea terrigena]